MGMCLGRRCFCAKSGGDSGLAIERDEEEQCRWKAAWALFARCGSRTSIGQRVNHDRLMAQIAKRVDDKRLLKLIRAFLNAGVMENGLLSSSVEGTPQGGPSTPLTQKVISNSRGW